MAQGAYRNTLASGVTPWAGEDPFHLFAGDRKIVTDRDTFGANVAQFQVCGRKTSDGKLYPLDPAASDGTQTPVPVIPAQPVDITKQIIGPVYTAAIFNHEALVWPAGAAYDTFAERKAAFPITGNVTVGKLL